MSQRPACTRCLRPQSACICRWITPVPHAVEVVILQHPLELHHPKGSARLLHLSLPSSRLLTGEVFDEAAWQPAGHTRHNLLLYPDRPGDQPGVWPQPPAPALAPGVPKDLSRLRLIVLDGTWRKSRKMLHLNPALQQLPRLSLRDMPASAYRIRRSHRSDQLSTLEAVCAALAQLEGDEQRWQPLLEAFDGFVAQQMGLAIRSPDL